MTFIHNFGLLSGSNEVSGDAISKDVDAKTDKRPSSSLPFEKEIEETVGALTGFVSRTSGGRIRPSGNYLVVAGALLLMWSASR